VVWKNWAQLPHTAELAGMKSRYCGPSFPTPQNCCQNDSNPSFPAPQNCSSQLFASLHSVLC
jgi:hypothetical protein